MNSSMQELSSVELDHVNGGAVWFLLALGLLGLSGCNKKQKTSVDKACDDPESEACKQAK